MNREIKFRVWTGMSMEYKVMAGYLGHFYVAGMDEKDAACMSQFNTIYRKETPVMQYTGLKDKNGKEIYEEDFVKETSFGNLYKTGDSINWVRVKRVCFSEGAFNIGNPSKIYSLQMDYEILGNVFENPDLLK